MRWCHLVSRLHYFIMYALGINYAKYQVSSFISLGDMVKTSFCHIGGTTCGGGAAWCLYCNILLPMPQEVTWPNMKSLALIVSEIWSKQVFVI